MSNLTSNPESIREFCRTSPNLFPEVHDMLLRAAGDIDVLRAELLKAAIQLARDAGLLLDHVRRHHEAKQVETSAPQVAECKDPNCKWRGSFVSHSHPADEKPFIVGMDLAKHDASDSTVHRCKHGNYFHSLGGVGAPDCGCFDVKTTGGI